MPTSRLLVAGCGLLATLLAPAHAALPDRGPSVDVKVVETFQGRNGPVFDGWEKPAAVLVVTGELDGYIEPCGCTGKENQKGGLSRRRNFLHAIEQAGWPLVAVDLGGQVRRFGRQSEAKFQSIADGLKTPGHSVALVDISSMVAEEGILRKLEALGLEVTGPDGR